MGGSHHALQVTWLCPRLRFYAPGVAAFGTGGWCLDTPSPKTKARTPRHQRRSMSEPYASYLNAFLLLFLLVEEKIQRITKIIINFPAFPKIMIKGVTQEHVLMYD